MKTFYWKLRKDDENSEIFRQAALLIKRGEVVAFPTETVYGLGADGLSGEAAAKIFAAKGRPADNPLILHIADRKDMDFLAVELNNNARILMEKFWPGPLTLVVRKASVIPDEVTAGLDTVAVRMPSHPLAVGFIKACGCPIAAPSANISGRPSPTNGLDVMEDMEGRIAAVLDGGSSGIGIESTVVDTTAPVPVILRPGGITAEMLTEVLGAVEIDPALRGDENLIPKSPGMKYRHYAPKASMYLLEGEAGEELFRLIMGAKKNGLTVGVLCSGETAAKLREYENIIISSWGNSCEELAENLFYILRDFDRSKPDVILSMSVEEKGLGLAIMNRLRKAAGYQILVRENNVLLLKNNAKLPEFMVECKK